MFVDADFPADPYPGARPCQSFVHEDGRGFAVRAGVDGRWRVDDADLAAWLDERGAEPLDARVPVLAYGSNACPSKITWLRELHGLAGPVIVLRAEVTGLAAVWAAGLRVVDDQRPATLAADSDARETHAVWLATPAQVRALDRCEGRGRRYDLAALRSGEIRLENGTQLSDVHAYVGCSPERMPLLVDGVPVRCADLPQAAARHLPGVPAATDGLSYRVVAP